MFLSLRCYSTSIKNPPLNESWKWIVEVNDTGTTKEIDFRSNTQIVNKFDNPFYVYSYNCRKTCYVGKVDPMSTLYLPLNLVYGMFTK